jgi:conjugal transfer ATP-binding protein TraC
MKVSALDEKIEIWGFDGSNIIFQNGDLGCAFKISPIPTNNLSDDEVNTLKHKTREFLNSLPENISLQFVFDVDQNTTTVPAHRDLFKNCQNPEVNALTAERLKKLEKDSISSPDFSYTLFLRQKALPATSTKNTFFNFKKERFNTEITKTFESESLRFKNLKNSLTTSLLSLGVTFHELSSNVIYEKIFKEWNPDRKPPEHPLDEEYIRDSINFSDAGIYEEGFLLGATHHRVLSLKNFPEFTVAGMAANFLYMPLSTRTLLTIHVPEQTKELSNLKTDRRIAWAMSKGKKTGAADLESTAKLGELEEVLQEMISRGEKIFHVSLQVVLKSQDKNALSSQVIDATSALRLLGGAESMTETLAAFDVFSEVAIPNTKATERVKKLKSSNLADFLPVLSTWSGHPRPLVVFKDSRDSFFSFDPFDSSLTNFNALITGGSGAGKSFLANYILLQSLADNPHLYFVDIGGSYKKLAENLGGSFIPLKLDGGISINPFDLSVNEKTPSDQKIKFLVGLVEMMTKEEGAARLPKLLRTEIEIAIKDVYADSPNSTPRLRDLKNKLTTHTDSEVQKIARVLSTWCGDSAFGKFLDQDSSISLNKAITAFDLKGLEQFPDLQAICLYIVTDLIWREVQTKNCKKFVVFDECWRTLKSEAGSAFIEECFRTFRKHNASAIAISQDIDDFAKSSISTAILPNCAVKWIMMQPQTNGERLKELLNLNDNEIESIKSLSQSKGLYSESFLIAGDKKAHLRIESTPLEYWIATTDPRDLSEISKLQENTNLPLIEIFKSLAEKLPNGASKANSMKGHA